MGIETAIIGAVVGGGLGLWGAKQARDQRNDMKNQYKQAEQRQLALEARAQSDEKRAQGLNDANLLRQRQRALMSSTTPKSGTLKTGAAGVLGSAPTAGKSALGY